MERPILILILLSCLFFFSACSEGTAYYHVIRGNYSFFQGEYQDANVQYLKMRKKDQYPDIISLNLGNVYYVLGETEAAENEWLKVADSEYPQLLFRLYFNRGNLYYEKSEFEMSYHFFRKALEILPDSEDAKRNLELSLHRLNATDLEKPTVEMDTAESDIGDDVDRVLQYIRRREEGPWISQEEESAKSVRDW